MVMSMYIHEYNWVQSTGLRYVLRKGENAFKLDIAFMSKPLQLFLLNLLIYSVSKSLRSSYYWCLFMTALCMVVQLPLAMSHAPVSDL